MSCSHFNLLTASSMVTGHSPRNRRTSRFDTRARCPFFCDAASPRISARGYLANKRSRQSASAGPA
eukprot:2045154-Alexandrium_andersonii.AAC.1